MLHQWEDDGKHWLLIRRSLDDPSKKTYYFVFAPQGTTLSEMVKAIGARWHVEEHFENGKDIGLDHYEVRSFIGWYRHVTLVLLALAYLAGICATDRDSTSPPATAGPATRPSVLPLTIRCPCAVCSRGSSGPLLRPHAGCLDAAWWRRCHQSTASYYHIKRRLKAS
jgi:hypothetical protein